MPTVDLEKTEARAAAAGGAEKRAYVRRVFSEIAPRYDLLNHLLSFNIDRGWRRRAIAALDPLRNPTGVYIDLCAGTLDVASELSQTRGFRGLVLGTDFAEPMLRAGLNKAPRVLVAPVTADALDLPVADDTPRPAPSLRSGSGTSRASRPLWPRPIAFSNQAAGSSFSNSRRHARPWCAGSTTRISTPYCPRSAAS
jgi:hypothetical protein